MPSSVVLSMCILLCNHHLHESPELFVLQNQKHFIYSTVMPSSSLLRILFNTSLYKHYQFVPDCTRNETLVLEPGMMKNRSRAYGNQQGKCWEGGWCAGVSLSFAGSWATCSVWGDRRAGSPLCLSSRLWRQVGWPRSRHFYANLSCLSCSPEEK